MPKNGDDFRAEIQALKELYAEELPSKLTLIAESWETVRSRKFEKNALDTLFNELHKLSGSGTTFGFSELSDLAKQMEAIVKQWKKEGAPVDADIALFEKLLHSLQSLNAEQPKTKHKPISSSDTYISSLDVVKKIHPLVYVVDDDLQFGKKLKVNIERFGYDVKFFDNVHKLKAAIEKRFPDALIMDVILSGEKDSSPELLQKISTLIDFEKLPLIFMTGIDDIDARIAAARLGADAFYIKPFDLSSLIERLNALILPSEIEPYRVLIIDDDVNLSMHYDLLLKQAGILTSVLNEPKNALERIKEFAPEMILMDLYMPSVNGMLLAKVIRQFEQYLSLPIVYLSSESDSSKQYEAMRTGGDDFMVKPVNDLHLVTMIKIRSKRAREIKAYLTKDGLTSLITHGALKEKLKVEMSRCKRNKSPLSFALIDVDKFKSVNDKFGHLVGDRVLKSLANLLKRRVRITDVVGRYGGEEFGIILPDCSLENGEELIENMRKDFEKVSFRVDKEKFNVTFSAGIGLYKGEETTHLFVKKVDDALYEAKHLGRNQCVRTNK